MLEDKWSNTPQEAKVKKTGEVVKGFTDGHGHFSEDNAVALLLVLVGLLFQA